MILHLGCAPQPELKIITAVTEISMAISGADKNYNSCYGTSNGRLEGANNRLRV